jgi:hypothetical protein
MINHLTETLRSMNLHARQRDALKQHLLTHRVIDRDFAHNIGLPECGKIKNLGARIMDLREEGMRIDTDTATDPANCHYRLAAAPDPRGTPAERLARWSAWACAAFDALPAEQIFRRYPPDLPEQPLAD